MVTRSRRAVAIGRERQGRRTHPAGAGIRLDDACAVPAVSNRPFGKSSEGGAGRYRVDRDLRADGFSGHVPDVAGEPTRLLRRDDRPHCRAASWNTSRHPARRTGLDTAAAGAGVEPACGISWPRARHQQLFRHRPTSRERACARRHHLSSRSIADLRQCRRGSGSGDEPASRKQARPSSAWSSAIFPRHPIWILRVPARCTSCTPNWQSRGTAFRVIGARGSVRDLLRADGVEGKIGRVGRSVTLESVLDADAGRPNSPDDSPATDIGQATGGTHSAVIRLHGPGAMKHFFPATKSF